MIPTIIALLYLKTWNVLSVVQCPSNAINSCELTGLSFQTIVIDDDFDDGRLLCNVLNPCRRSIIIVASKTFTIQFQDGNSGEGCTVETGLPIVIPTTFAPANFDDRGVAGDIFCDGESSCINTQINLNGKYPAGITLNARGKNSLVNSEVRCDLEFGQQCRVICSDNFPGTCAGLTIVCNSCNCVCTGSSCPPIVFGANCPDISRVGVNRRFPDILCIPSLPRPDECLDPPFIKFDNNGVIECAEVADCCTCERVECNECQEVRCSGERSCNGIPIVVNGQSGGAMVSCGFERSCDRADITGNNIVMVNCVGTRACHTSRMVLNSVIAPGLSGLSIGCDSTEGCDGAIIAASNVEVISCGASRSCSDSLINAEGISTGMTFDCTGSQSCRDSEILLTNVFMWSCGAEFSCFGSNITVNCLNQATGGCTLDCSGTQACRDSVLTVANVETINCGNSGACFTSELNIQCISQGCLITCNGNEACRNSEFIVSNSAGLVCMGSFVCAGSRFILSDNSNNALSCNGQSACLDAIITNLTNINSFECSGFNACRNSRIVSTCNEELGCALQFFGPDAGFDANIISTNIQEVSCEDDRACGSIILNITPLNNFFIINCLTPLTCIDARIQTVITDTSITSVQGPRCGATEACLRTNFIFDASNLSNELIIEQIICEGIRACKDTQYTLINAQISASNILCNGLGSCDDILKITCISNNGTITDNCIL